ncbi:MAG TPA: mannose-1-phosphate guanylyltransferase/mannose-6-phosphate isomerase [Rhodospirillaceae bacterium]|nr:MAG: mannose-1-phosphate guanylyltransferase/mannose-6-phosphate isomerase [Alphaproteobacteria bacterium GWF2_58_20]HAU28911.1 mannose-1-phosphate guanylyltransferase/mannose-6-phosphate isomerase [Rhodospirillaceae bacterium]
MSNKTRIQPVILCGGSGTRLWPLSRTGFPKQFLSLTGNSTLFQQAIQRLSMTGGKKHPVSAPMIVINEEHRFIAIEQLRETGIEPGPVLLEPVGRNTAPALTLAALSAQETGDDPILVVTPSDQMVTDLPIFTTAIQQAIDEAMHDSMVILGISPNRPETGYGYIKAGAPANTKAVLTPTFIVECFVEKPDEATAKHYLEEGGYFWNAGIFVLKASVWLKAIEHFCPEISKATRKAWAHRTTDTHFIRPGKAEFSSVPAKSIDYAVMEHCPGSPFPIRMVPLDAGWSDLGAWDAIWDNLPKDECDNAHLGDVVTTDSHNTLVHATSRLVSLVGVDNLVIIETPDAILVANKSRSHDVKHIVNQLDAQKRHEHTHHRKVYRPWGWYDNLETGPFFKVKRIQVKPKASISLQKHNHRAEHWIVIEGTAEITCGEKRLTLSMNQSTYIPLGETHRLSNPGDTPLEIIEVQSGSYLGEDDIVRFADQYGRMEIQSI